MCRRKEKYFKIIKKELNKKITCKYKLVKIQMSIEKFEEINLYI